ncbi:Uncharacterised protein [Mycobacteroides abscessus subsp. abscessus]|uniref:hypothetical protein n=1 Tax=Mycobacteroides abscessus TaxID=36809 RepID=UPI0009A9066A|nr:hypothetical protein [Mycobacteroides abscessus]SKV08696.1 Uncharacterised protein [Mycobacteroides abscessus subsp. abscessus]SKY71244.1 Uncharacterised protein [Mycobacteroides abscessus subsp. abscessus]
MGFANIETELRLAEALTAINDIRELTGIANEPVERGYVVHRVTAELREWLPSVKFDQLAAIADAIVDNLAEVNLIPVGPNLDEPIGFEIVEKREFSIVPLNGG